ncbi:MAG: hypothetical protein KDA86_01120 [Planctomycetaceae bacterium]|nr:hypothetical protein [Planctomycetaceae bacterium]
MNHTQLTIERIVALGIVLVQVLCASTFSTVSPSLGILAGAAFLLSLPGLLLIWYRGALSSVGFKRGVFHKSPPMFVDVFGWLFLIGLPVIFLYNLLP